MASVNKAIIVGNLGRDPELKYTPDGRPVARFSVATTESWTGRDGEKREKTEWHKIVAWGKLAEICGQYLRKGKQVYIEGRIETRQFEDRDKQQRSITEINANQMVMLGSRGDSEGRGGYRPASGGSAPHQREDGPPDEGPMDATDGSYGGPAGGGGDDDVPF